MYKAWISDVKLWPVDAVQRMHHKISYYQHIYCVWPIEYVLQLTCHIQLLKKKRDFINSSQSLHIMTPCSSQNKELRGIHACCE